MRKVAGKGVGGKTLDSAQVDRFFADTRLGELVERTSSASSLSEMINMIGMLELQHTRMLAWCLSPHSGHGQNDAILKDLLVAAYAAADKATGLTKKFFKRWTPARIRTCGFGAAFLQCELHIKGLENIQLQVGRRMVKHNGRLDLLIIDPQNRLLIVIENKYGAALGKDQLARYLKLVAGQILADPEYKGFECAFIVMDMYNLHERADEEGTAAKPEDEWAFIDYSWLAAAADRARIHADNRSEGARLLMGYCEAQTQWQTRTDEKLSELASAIAGDHEAVVRRMRDLQTRPFTDWPSSAAEPADRQLLYFVMQQKLVAQKLLPMLGIAQVRSRLLRLRGDLTEEHLWGGQTWLHVVSPAMSKWATSDDDWWPLHVHVFRHRADSEEDGAESIFYIRVQWNAARWPQSHQSPQLVAALRTLCSGRKSRAGHLIDKFVGCSGGGSGGYVGNADAAAMRTLELLDAIDKLIAEHKETPKASGETQW